MSINFDKTTEAIDTQIATPYSIPRVNLLPGEVLERRTVRKVQGGIGIAALAAVALAGGVYVLSVQDANKAGEELAAEQAVTTQLNAEKAKYADVPKTLALVEQAIAARESAMAQDIAWSTVMGQIAATYPSELWISTLTANLTNAPGGASSAAAQNTSSVATLTFTGGAKSHTVVADWLDSLKKVPNIIDPKMQSSVLNGKDGKKSVDYATTAQLNENAFSTRAERTGN